MCLTYCLPTIEVKTSGPFEMYPFCLEGSQTRPLTYGIHTRLMFWFYPFTFHMNIPSTSNMLHLTPCSASRTCTKIRPARRRRRRDSDLPRAKTLSCFRPFWPRPPKTGLDERHPPTRKSIESFGPSTIWLLFSFRSSAFMLVAIAHSQ